MLSQEISLIYKKSDDGLQKLGLRVEQAGYVDLLIYANSHTVSEMITLNHNDARKLASCLMEIITQGGRL